MAFIVDFITRVAAEATQPFPMRQGDVRGIETPAVGAGRIC